MESKVVLCADTASLRYPEALGLEGESLEGQCWLEVHSSAETARRRLRDLGGEVPAWIASADDVDAINMAAVLKADCPERTVCLLAPDATGSLRSRASRAGIDEVWGTADFVSSYTKTKGASRDGVQGGSLPGKEASAQARSSREDLPRPDLSTKPSTSGLDVLCKSVEDDAEFSGAKGAAALVDDGNEDAAPLGFLLPVLSGSGGAGKSTIAALCGAVAKRQGRNVAVLDLDLQFGDEKYLLGLPDAMCADDLLESPSRMDRLSSEDGMPVLIAAPQKLESFEAVMPRVGELLKMLRKRFDLVVVNTGAFWTDLHAQLLDASSKALFLVDQRPASLWACKHALDLCGRCGIASSPFEFIANKTGKGCLYTSLDLSCALGGASAEELSDGGPDVEELLSTGNPRELLDSRNQLCLDIDALLMRILPESVGVESAYPAGSGSRFAFWRSRKSRRTAGEGA